MARPVLQAIIIPPARTAMPTVGLIPTVGLMPSPQVPAQVPPQVPAQVPAQVPPQVPAQVPGPRIRSIIIPAPVKAPSTLLEAIQDIQPRESVSKQNFRNQMRKTPSLLSVANIVNLRRTEVLFGVLRGTPRSDIVMAFRQ